MLHTKGCQSQFADHGRTGPLTRAYLALIWGAPTRKHGTIDVPLARSTKNRLKIAVVPEAKFNAGLGKFAITHYELLETYFDTDGMVRVGLVRCKLETGRTHQIRVHLAHIHHPLCWAMMPMGRLQGQRPQSAGKGTRSAGASSIAKRLHASELGFEHPITGFAF